MKKIYHEENVSGAQNNDAPFLELIMINLGNRDTGINQPEYRD